MLDYNTLTKKQKEDFCKKYNIKNNVDLERVLNGC
jgi:hypothetical protein